MPACLHGSFQYNFCYCSMYGACAGRIQGIVSIQLLLLFYLTPAIEKGILLRFNTTFVTVLSAFLLVSYFIISQDIP